MGVALSLMSVALVSGTFHAQAPGLTAQLILVGASVGSAPLFAYALRPGRLGALWYLWWISPVVALCSLGWIGREVVITAGGAPAMQALALFMLLWAMMMTVPLWWLFIYLPWEFLVCAVRVARADGIGAAATHALWGSLLGLVLMIITTMLIAVVCA